MTFIAVVALVPPSSSSLSCSDIMGGFLFSCINQSTNVLSSMQKLVKSFGETLNNLSLLRNLNNGGLSTHTSVNVTLLKQQLYTAAAYKHI
jgi:hypothetical protein